jgi:hypothetical protein
VRLLHPACANRSAAAPKKQQTDAGGVAEFLVIQKK